MAAAMASSGRATELICFDANQSRSLSLFSTKRGIPFEHVQIKALKQQMPDIRMVRSKQYKLAPLLARDTSDISISSPSPTHIIRAFYLSINEKDLDKLDRLLSDDCFFEDYSFPTPFQGKKEVLKFLEELTKSMGQNVEFNVEHFCEGGNNMATVKWHLDWKKKQIPFTRGCSYYELSTKGERLVIKKIQVLIESPLKPGGFALAFFKIVTSLFDAFPDATERFLNNTHVIFQMLLNLYNMVLKPIMNPIIEWYIKLWSFMFSILSFTLKILQYIANIFNK